MRRVFDRDPLWIAQAPFQRRHWRALVGIIRTFDQPAEVLRRYLSNSGDYPWRPTLSTPVGPVSPLLMTRHDLLTVNEVFCRRDYGRGPYNTVVDIGANIGLASLYFLTRSPSTRVWAFEPDPANVAQLRANLADFEDRYTLTEAAVVADDSASVRFTFDGRYGHLAATHEPGAAVPAVNIATMLRLIARDAGEIDLIKIDTEGNETSLINALPEDIAIDAIVYEDYLGLIRWHGSARPRVT